MNPNDPYQGTPPQHPQTPPQPNANGQYDVVPPPMPSVGGGVNGGHNPYEFIMSSNQKPKHSFNIGGGQSPAMRLLLIIGGITVIVIIVGIIIASLVPTSVPTENLKSIVQRQAEIARVASLGESQAANQSTKNHAYTIDLSISSDETKLVDFLASNGTSMNDKTISLLKDTQTDTALADAKTTGTYDTSLEQTLAAQLKSYLSEVKSTYESASNTELKGILQTMYTNGTLLLKQVDPTAS